MPSKFPNDMAPYGGPLKVATTFFKSVGDGGTTRKFPMQCRCLKEIVRLIALNNYLHSRGLSMPLYMEEQLAGWIAGDGFGCEWHWNKEGNTTTVANLYYILSPEQGLIKIGYSMYPYERLGGLRAHGFGEKANILALEHGGKELETEIHRKFKESRQRIFAHDGGTEIFTPNEEMMNHIKEVAETNGMNREPRLYEHKFTDSPTGLFI